MHNLGSESAVLGPISLLKNYSFESTRHSYDKVLDSWLERFPLDWVNLALVESLYQGRYKVVSVEQILTLWQRRGKPSYHFNHDFERLVSTNLPKAFEPKGVKQPLKSKRNSIALNHRSIQNNSRFIESSNQGSQGLSHSQVVGAKPELAKFESEVNQSHPERGSAGGLSLEKKLPLSDLDLFEALESFQENSSLIGLDHEIVLEATKPPTMMEEQMPTLIDSTEQVERESLVIRSEDASIETSNVSVPVASSLGETLNPIHQFVPQSSSTEFCSKLTAMAQINV
jgi:hypothetical protein